MTTSHDIDRMIAELKAAGWEPKTPTIWRSPSGMLFLGPAGAWHRMKGIATTLQQRDIASGRDRLIHRSIKLRAEIEQIFTDCASWNDNARKPHEEPIDPDPDGQLRRIADALDRTLASESQREQAS